MISTKLFIKFLHHLSKNFPIPVQGGLPKILNSNKTKISIREWGGDGEKKREKGS